MGDPFGGMKNPFTLQTETDPTNGDLLLYITAAISTRDQMRMGSAEHLITRLLGALDDAIEMWKKETV